MQVDDAQYHVAIDASDRSRESEARSILRRLILFLSLLGTLVLGAIGVVILVNVGLPGIGGELVIPLTALTFAIWGFAGVLALWDARRSWQAFAITVPIMLPFVFASQLQFFALVGVWGAVLALLAYRVYQRDSTVYT